MFVCPLNIFVGVSGPLDVEHRILCVLPVFVGEVVGVPGKTIWVEGTGLCIGLPSFKSKLSLAV